MIKITEGSYTSFKDNKTDSQHFYYKDENDVRQQGNVASLKDWTTFEKLLKKED